MLEVEALLEGRQLDAGAIIARMDQATRLEAAGYDDDWGPVLLAKKMRQRITEAKFFDEPARGVFRRRTTSTPADAPADVPAPSDAAKGETAAVSGPRSLESLVRRKVDDHDDDVPGQAKFDVLGRPVARPVRRRG